MSKPTVPLQIKWGTPELIRPTVLTDGAFSVTNGADVPGETAFPLTILFNDARVELTAPPPDIAQEEKCGALYATWTGTLCVPVVVTPEKPDGVWFRSDLRFFLAKDEATRALLVVDLAGEQLVREYPYGQKLEPTDITESVVHKARTAPAGSYNVSLLLIAERQDTAAGVTLKVDSLDAEINPNFRA